MANEDNRELPSSARESAPPGVGAELGVERPEGSETAESKGGNGSVEQQIETAAGATGFAAAIAPPAPLKDPYLIKVEKVLEENLDKVYFAMTPESRAVFKTKGEATAGAIRALIESAKVKAGAILRLIRDWLKLIPGVNKFFLEQEAKLKTDKIIAIAKERAGETGRDAAN